MSAVTLSLRTGQSQVSLEKEKPAESLSPNIEDIKQIDENSEDLFQPVLGAPTLSKQISELKVLAKNVKEDQHQICAIVLVQWYLSSTKGSAVKKALAGCFNAVKSDNFQKLVTEQVSCHITSVCEEERLSTDVVLKLSKCFDNFKLGEKAVFLESEAVVTYLLEYLEDRLESICESDVAPVDKARLSEEASECSRTLVAVVKGTVGDLKKELVEKLSSITINILTINDLPLDLKSNCGIIAIVSMKTQDMSQLTSLIHDLAEEKKLEVTMHFYKKIHGNAGAVLSILHGIMSTLSLQELSLVTEDQVMLENILKIYLKIALEEKENAIVLGHSRGMLTWSTKLLETSLNDEQIFSCVEKLQEYIWGHLEHSVDSVKHNAKNTLGNIIVGCKKAGGKCIEFLDAFLMDTLGLPKHKKGRFVSLSSLAKSYSVEKVIEKYPNIHKDILDMSKEYALVAQISELYEVLIISHHELCKDDLKKWMQVSVKPLLNCFNEREGETNGKMLEGLLKKAVKMDQKVIEFVLAGINEKEGDSHQLCLALCCLKMGRELGQSWDFAKNEQTMKLAFSHPLDEVRMQALNLFAEAHSGIEVFSEKELIELLKFTRYNLALQSAASRQIFTIAIKKILNRIVDGAAALDKKLTQRKFEPNREEFTNILAYYGNFLTKLSFLMFENLFAGANFPRRDTSLTILYLIHKIIGFSHKIPHINLSKTINESTAHTLISTLHDSYEFNKDRALGLLRDVPPNFLRLDHPDVVRQLLDETVALMTSPKPPDSITAKYMMKLLLTAPAAAWVFADVLGMARADPGKVKLMAAVYIRNLLAEQLSVAEGSLIEAAGSAAMYGTMVVLRGVYEEVERKEYCDQWNKLSQDLIRMSYNIWRVVSPVVASDSPEGHLPMDLGDDGKKQLKKIMRKSIGGSGDEADKIKRDVSSDLYCAVFNRVDVSDAFPDEIVEDILGDIFESSYRKAEGLPVKVTKDQVDDGFEEMDEQTDQDDLNQSIVEEEDLSESGLTKAKEVSSQMLLLCAWRSVKEVALFLGDLCQTFSSSSTNIVTSTQILDISSFLMDLLSETKHRGAFEQAYVAFTQLCATLWKSSNPELHSHPQELLEELLENLRAARKSGKDSLCATRRSAGVPFIVQAVVSTDPDPSGAVFKRAMATLLELAGDQTAEAEARVHSFNVLKALYKDTRLGEIVSVFVEEGVKVAVVGFKAANWAERNAATLLFSSLMTRIFGVKREKDTLSSKNCLTGKVFFQRYPSLHPFLLEQLVESSTQSSAGGVLELHPALYPILLILARIYPSPSEQVNNALKLSSFLPLVSKCAGSPILQTRQLAARALVPILPSQEAADFVKDLFTKLEDPKISQNLIHGMLLQLKEFVIIVPEVILHVVKENIIKESLINALVKDNKCHLTAAEFIGVVNMVTDHSTDKTELETLTKTLADKVFDEKEMNVNEDTVVDIWKPLFMKSATEYLSKASLPKDEHGFIIKLLVHPEYEVRLSVLETLTQNLATQSSPIPASDLTSLLYVEKHDECLERLLDCCSLLPKQDLQVTDHVPFLISLISTTNNDDVRVSCLKLSSKLMSSVTDQEVKLSWSKLIRESCGPEQTNRTREAAVNCLLENVDLIKNLPSSSSPTERNACMILWSSLFIIMFDDDTIIRNIVGKIAMVLNNSQKEVLNSMAVELVMSAMIKIVGRSWPGGALILVLGHLLTTVFDEDSLDGGVSAENDRAFDKNEMNIFQELITMAVLMLPPLAKLVVKLSPGLQKSTFDSDLPPSLMTILLPELPGGVRVYSNGQLLEYLSARSCKDASEAELVMMGMIFSSLRCNRNAENCQKFLKSWNETCKKKGKTFVMDSFRRMVEKTNSQSG